MVISKEKKPFPPRVGLVYDNRMLKHFMSNKEYQPENPNQKRAIWNKLDSVAEKVAKGELDSAVAVVSTPGHHAEPDIARGFCLFYNVAVAASYLLNERPELGIRKILIVDWDVRHGNGTQKVFWKDNRVFFFSVHRYNGTFYPPGKDGCHSMIGEGLGAGYNAFDPDIILISGGFDAAVGDPLWKCRVTPFGFSIMMKKLMDFTKGKIVFALEGGYNLESLADSFLACVKKLY
ncbi:hypothetical protein MKX01_024476 [Papaver californicum]|nr:hypothetical protein MKX01_024476 [Papaver californicum]